MHCPQCGTQLTPDARFCSVCGTPRAGTNVSEAKVSVNSTVGAQSGGGLRQTFVKMMAGGRLCL